VWVEWLLIEGEPLIWAVLIAAVVGAGVAWTRQRGGWGERPPVRAGWGAVAALAMVVGVAAVAGQTVGLWVEVGRFIESRPALLGWWVGAAGAATVAWGFLAHAWRGEPRLARQCRKCRYDMSTLDGVTVCPECGRRAKSERELRPVVVRRWAVVAGVLLVGLGGATTAVVAVWRDGWAKSMPDWALELCVTRVDGLPDALRAELHARRMADSDSYNAWMGRFSRCTRLLVERALNADAKERYFYTGLLQGRRLDEASLAVAIEGLRSDDRARRSSAAVVLAETGPARVPFNLLVPVLDGADGEAAEKAGWLVAWQSEGLLREVSGNGARPGSVRDVDTIRRVLRALTDVGTLDDDWELLRGLADHYDSEVAARAAVLMAMIAGRTGPVPPNVLRRSVLGRRELEKLPGGSGLPAHARTGALLTWGRGPEVVAILSDPDASVRLALCRQLTPVGLVAPNTPWSDGVRPWMEVLPALEERLRSEDDPAVKAELKALIDTVCSGPKKP